MPSLRLYRLLLSVLLTGCWGAPGGSEQALSKHIQAQARQLRLAAPLAEAEPVLKEGLVRVLRQVYPGSYLYAFGNGEAPLAIPWPPAPAGLSPWPCGLKPEDFPLQQTRTGELINLLLITPSERDLRRLLIRAGWGQAAQPPLQPSLLGPVLGQGTQAPALLWGRSADLRYATRRGRERSLRSQLLLWQSPRKCEGAQVWLGAVTQAATAFTNRLGLWSGPAPQPVAPARDRARDLVLGGLGGFLPPTPLHLLARQAHRQPVEGLNRQGDAYVSDGMLGVIDQR